MPPKNGPASAKTASAPAEDPAAEEASQNTKEPAQASSKAAEAPEAATDETEPQVQDASQQAKDDAKSLYDEGTELWTGAIDGLWFAFPRITNITPTRQWLRAIYPLTELAQTFEWLALAKVHPIIQDRTDILTDTQYRALFNAWFTDGEVSLPK